MDSALAFGQTLIGKPYGLWQGESLALGWDAPFWNKNEPVPSIDCITTVNCTGLVNLILRYRNKPLPYSYAGGIGGTMSYYDTYKNVLDPFDIEHDYPTGTLIGRQYRDFDDQGHVAIVIDGLVLHASIASGVEMTKTVAESHCGGYYEYAVFPDKWLE
jgi:hypothetical protein